MPYADNKGADQIAHQHSLISAFVVHCSLAISNVSRLYSASVSKQTSLSLTWLQIPEDTFSHDMAQVCVNKFWKRRSYESNEITQDTMYTRHLALC